MTSKENICECGHKGREKVVLDGSGRKYWEHNPSIKFGIAESHSFSCPCKKFTPKKKQEENS